MMERHGIPAAFWLPGLLLTTHTGMWFYSRLQWARKVHEISRTMGNCGDSKLWWLYCF